MAWRFVVQPNNLLAIFSEIVDSFIIANIDESEAIEFAFQNYSCEKEITLEKINRAKLNPHRWEESLKIIEIAHGKEYLDKILNEIKLDF